MDINLNRVPNIIDLNNIHWEGISFAVEHAGNGVVYWTIGSAINRAAGTVMWDAIKSITEDLWAPNKT